MQAPRIGVAGQTFVYNVPKAWSFQFAEHLASFHSAERLCRPPWWETRGRPL